MSDMCSSWKTKDEEELRCRVLSGYAILCQEAGVNMTGWRDQTHCGEALTPTLFSSAAATTLTMASQPWFFYPNFKAASDSRVAPLLPTPPLSDPVPPPLCHAFCLVFSLPLFFWMYVCVCPCVCVDSYVWMPENRSHFPVLLFVWGGAVTFIVCVCVGSHIPQHTCKGHKTTLRN